MMYFNNPKNFPVHALPASLCRPVLAIHAQVKAPLEIVAASVLTAAAVSVQHLGRVRRPSGPLSPMNLAFLTLAVTGDRKTAADEVALAGIKAFEASQAALYRVAKQGYDAELRVWKARDAGIMQQIKQLANSNESSDTAAAELKALHEQKPVAPTQTRLVYTNVTPQALARSIAKNSPSALLGSNDASGLLFGPGLSDLSFLCETWSAAAIPVDRVSSESFLLENYRLSQSLMVQPSEFARYRRKRGGHMRDIGYLSRCLFVHARSIQGDREIYPGEVVLTKDIDCFHQRGVELLNINNARPTDEIIEFDPQATWLWIEFFNETENQLRDNHLYADIRDFGSRIADNAARLAGIFNRYEGSGDFIDVDSMQRSIEICKWYLAEFKMNFGTFYTVPQEAQDAFALDQWASRFNRAPDGFIYLEKTRILQFGPNRMRSRERLNRTLSYMVMFGRAAYFSQGRKTYVQLNPSLPSFGPPLLNGA